jgi:hypothetical protein
MIRKLTRWISLLATLIFLDFGCTSYENKLIGSWIPADRKGIKQSSYEVSFFTDTRVVYYGPNGKEKLTDSLTYELMDNSKRLRFKSKSGEIRDMVVIELTDSNLILSPENQTGDTLRYVRQ